MEQVMSGIAQEGLWIMAVVLIGAVASFLLLAQGNSLTLLLEICRTVWSMFASPFHYLRKTISELSQGEANPRLQSIDHYLLRGLLIAAQVILLLTVFVGTGIAIASAVVAFLPSWELRHELSTQSELLAKTQVALKVDTDAKNKDDADWTNRREELIQQAQQEVQQKRTEAKAALQADESAVQSPEGVQALNTLRHYFETQAGQYGAFDQAKQFVNRMPISEADTKALISYCDHWQALASLSNRGPKSLEQIREEVQPDHAATAQRAADETAQVLDLKASIKQLQEERDNSYHPGRFVLMLVVFFLAFLAYVWAAGTTIEVFAMALYLSNDVKQIRTQGEQEPAHTQLKETLA